MLNVFPLLVYSTDTPLHDSFPFTLNELSSSFGTKAISKNWIILIYSPFEILGSSFGAKTSGLVPNSIVRAQPSERTLIGISTC